MFVSFFPRPKVFFLSAIVWTALAMAFWYGFARNLIGSAAPGGVGVEIFWSAASLWFDLYFALCGVIVAGAWMVFAAVIWSILGTGVLALIGIRLPRIEFFNQRVEAAYRKELVLGEDDPARASPPTLSVLFGDIRRNYFRLYLNFMYFNIGRIVYLQSDVIFPYVLLAPTIIAGRITLGAMNQILNAFTQVRTSFQYLVNSWSTIVELISIYQRLRGFEARIHGEQMPSIETQKEAAS